MYPEAAKQANQLSSCGQISGAAMRGGDIQPICKEKEIPEKVKRLFQQLDYLEQTASALVSRLQPILSPEPACGLDGANAAPSMTELAAQLNEARSKAQNINDTLQSVLVRLEL